MKQNRNEYIKHDDYYEMIVRSEKYGAFYVQIDSDDYEKCKLYVWGIFHTRERPDKGLVETFYIQNGKAGLLHRFIMNAQKGTIVDHQDKNTMNNRKSNLRFCTVSQNQMNKRVTKENKSGCPGVFFNRHLTKGANPWCAIIKVNYKQIYLGYFKTYDEAVVARKNGEKKYFGEFAPNLDNDNFLKNSSQMTI